MEARLDFYGSSFTAKFAKYINSAGAVLTGSALPSATQELVKIRASQINGCAGCLDMHTKEAAAAGETAVRLHLVAAWREAEVVDVQRQVRHLHRLAAGDRLVIIDLPQVVDLVGNPRGMDFLLRDCANMCAWFRSRGLDADEQELFGELMAHAF